MKTKKWLLSAAAFAGLLAQGTASAQQPVAQPAPQGAPVVLDYYNGYDNGNGGNCPRGGILAGFEFTLLKPHIDSGFALVGPSAVENEGGGGADPLLEIAAQQQYPTYNYEGGYRIWLGYIGDSGFGGRVRYWNMDAGSNLVSRNKIGEEAVRRGETDESVRNVTSSLDMDAFDAEMLIRGNPGGQLIVTGGVGIRYGQVRMDTTLMNFGLVEDPGIVDVIGSTVRFEGVGPTFSADLLYPIGDSGLAAFVGGRGSLLYGQTLVTVITGLTNDTTADPPEVRNLREKDDFAWGLDTQIGVQYGRDIGRFSLFVSAAIEAQVWGNVTYSGFAGPGNRLSHDDTLGQERIRSNETLGLFGYAFAIGISR